MLKVRKGSGEEIPLIQGKEQRLRFAGAAVKRSRQQEPGSRHWRLSCLSSNPALPLHLGPSPP